MSLLAQQAAMLRHASPPPSGHSTDFSEYPTGVAPSDWTPRWVTSGVAYTVEEFEGNNVLRAVVSTSGRHAISWDQADSAADDIEVLAKVGFANVLGVNETGPRIVVRGGGSASSEAGYTEQLREAPESGQADRYEIMKVVSGSFSGIANAFINVQPRWYWFRLRVEGEALMAKCWVDGDSEPGAWGISDTDDALSSGWTAFGAQVANTYYCGFFSYNDEGGSAPGP